MIAQLRKLNACAQRSAVLSGKSRLPKKRLVSFCQGKVSAEAPVDPELKLKPSLPMQQSIGTGYDLVIEPDDAQVPLVPHMQTSRSWRIGTF